MPIIREYDQRLNAPNRPLSQPADPGAAARAGDGLKALSGALATVSRTAFDIAEQSEMTSLQVETARARAEFAERMQRAKETGEAADPEYVKSVADAAQEAAAKLADGKATRRGAEAARAHGAQFAAGMQMQAIGDNAAAIGEQAKLTALEAQNINRNTLRSSPQQFEAILGETLAHLDGPAYAHVDAGLREQLKQNAKAGLAESAVEGVIHTRSPIEAKKLLDSGMLDSYLPAERKRFLYNLAESRRAEMEGRANLEALLRMNDLAENGELTKARALEAYDAGIFKTAPQALSFFNRSQERAKEIQRQRELDVAINLGDPVALVKYTPKEKQEGFDRFAAKLIQDAGEDEAGRETAINQIVARGREIGEIPSRMKAQLESASVARPAQFVSAAKWFEGLAAVDPGYANAHVSPKQAALFHVYTAAKAAGQSDAHAIELVKMAGDPETLRKFQNEMPGSVLSDIEGALNPYFGSAASNAGWAKKSIADMAKLRMAFGDSTATEAAEWATEQFKARHAMVGGRWIPTGGNVSPDLAPAFDEYLARVPAALQKHGATQDDIAPGGYDLRADRQTRIDGSLQLYEKDTGMPIPGYRVSPREALDAYSGVKQDRIKKEIGPAASRIKALREAKEQVENVGWGVAK